VKFDRRTLSPILLGLALAATPAFSQTPERPSPRKGEDDCPAQTILCGSTVNGTLAAQDCQDDKGRLLDAYAFSGTNGQDIVATLFSSAFEPHLELLFPSGEDAAEAQGENPGSTARIDYTLTQTSSSWKLIPKADDPGVTGGYSLTLQCSDDGNPPPPPPPAGFFIDPAYPDFSFRVRIGPPGAAIPGRRETGCQSDTVCVSGAVPGRTEVYLRILGPRPNGFLWPTIIRFTPAQVVVDIRQASSGQERTYTLAAVLPGNPNLSGSQDRTGFLP
jgi:hypothetical protein